MPPPPLTWLDLHHRELTVRQLHDLLRLRAEVFVVEQQCAYLDVDGADLAGDTRHLLAHDGADHEAGLAAYARILPPTEDDGAVRIGRVVVAPDHRGGGLAREVMERALAASAALWPHRPVRVQAQAHLERFYAGLGFTALSDVYDEDGIPHLDMVRDAG